MKNWDKYIEDKDKEGSSSRWRAISKGTHIRNEEGASYMFQTWFTYDIKIFPQQNKDINILLKC